jgi:predicted transposase/invertase (TIGR01784 family)
MARSWNPHDRFFRKIGADPAAAAGLLENFLPADLRRLADISAPEIVRDSFVSDELRAYYSDLLFRIRLAGVRAFIYFLFERKSFPNRFVHPQILGYVQRAWELRTGPDLPSVVPVLVYHGPAPWGPTIPGSPGSSPCRIRPFRGIFRISNWFWRT